MCCIRFCMKNACQPYLIMYGWPFEMITCHRGRKESAHGTRVSCEVAAVGVDMGPWYVLGKWQAI